MRVADIMQTVVRTVASDTPVAEVVVSLADAQVTPKPLMIQATADVQEAARHMGLLNLITTRASQLNGCAYCLDALAWTEAVTLISRRPVPDPLYEAVRRQFSERQLVDLTLAVVAINEWNRLGIAFRIVPGTY